MRTPIGETSMLSLRPQAAAKKAAKKAAAKKKAGPNPRTVNKKTG